MKKILIIVLSFIIINNMNAQSKTLLQLTQQCKPWRVVKGYNLLCSELNSFNCARVKCQGTSTKTVLTNFLLQDLNNSNYMFSSAQQIPIAIQNQIIAQANNWANAHKPANTIVEAISFIADIVTSLPTLTYAGIDIKVTYIKCDNNTKLPN